ncbi:hypothetical protein [Streptomyces sp. NPDC021020]|uniref:hypothetical protein n=1 Tax=Streptomyces sp. NPDC021020 TaxID=3365109 RepID=UPI0037BDCF02
MTDDWERALTAARDAVRDPDRIRSDRARRAAEVLCAEQELPLARSLGPQLTELVALLDGLGMADLSGALLDHVAASLRARPGLFDTLAPALGRLAAALAAHGRYEAATWASAASLEGATDRGAVLANLAALTLRAGDTARAAEFAFSARRFAGNAKGAEALAVSILGIAVSAEAARREGEHAEADRLVDELAWYVQRLVARVGDDHPASLSALAALASAEFASAEAAGEWVRMERAVDVLAVAAQRMAATLGGRHPRSLAVLRSLASAEYELARTSGDVRRLAGAESLVVAALRRAEGQWPEERQERPGQAGRHAAGRGRSGAQLRDAAESLIDGTDLLLAEEQAACVRRGEDSRPMRRRFTNIRRQLLLARSLLDDLPATAYALALDAGHELGELASTRRGDEGRAATGEDVAPEDASLNSPRRPAP